MRIDIDAEVEEVFNPGHGVDYYVVISACGYDVARIKKDYISELQFEREAEMRRSVADWFSQLSPGVTEES